MRRHTDPCKRSDEILAAIIGLIIVAAEAFGLIMLSTPATPVMRGAEIAQCFAAGWRAR